MIKLIPERKEALLKEYFDDGLDTYVADCESPNFQLIKVRDIVDIRAINESGYEYLVFSMSSLDWLEQGDLERNGDYFYASVTDGVRLAKYQGELPTVYHPKERFYSERTVFWDRERKLHISDLPRCADGKMITTTGEAVDPVHYFLLAGEVNVIRKEHLKYYPSVGELIPFTYMILN